jgi:hypothetical protein
VPAFDDVGMDVIESVRRRPVHGETRSQRNCLGRSTGVRRPRTDVNSEASTAGTLPPEEFDRRYVAQAWLAYLHIAPGVLYLLLAPLQLAYRFRSRHYAVHPRLGRVLVGAAMVSGIFTLIFGGLFSFGGVPEASAAVGCGAARRTRALGRVPLVGVREQTLK